MTRIIILFNHFQIQDGVARSAIGMANALVQKPGTEVTLRPLFKYDPTMIDRLDSRVTVKPVFRHYFPGFSRLVSKVPMKWLHNWLIGDKYDIEVGLCMSLPIKIVAAYPAEGSSKKLHCYDTGHSNGSMQPKNLHCYDKSHRRAVMHFAWMHGYDIGLTLKAEYERIGKVICVSKFNADRLKEEARDSFDIDHAYNLLDDQEIRDKGYKEIPIDRTENVQFVSVGRMSPEKGYIRLIEICKKLKDEGYKFNLWLIGDGPQREELEQKAKALEAEDVVTFLGQQSNPHAYTSKSDVFICSSFAEGYSTACTEAIMLGVPVITTDVSGGQEIIDEAECGLIVSKESDEELYLAMKKVLDNQNIISNWKSTLKSTKDRFSYKNRAEKLYKIFGME